jgi:hypothetical protein
MCVNLLLSAVDFPTLAQKARKDGAPEVGFQLKPFRKREECGRFWRPEVYFTG